MIAALKTRGHYMKPHEDIELSNYFEKISKTQLIIMVIIVMYI